ncbi:MAG: SPFH domain-containing protein [Gemmatimonadales bacterium]
MLTPTIIGVLVSVLIVIVVLMSAIRILPEYERGVVFRLGRLRPTDYGPGLFLLIPIVDRMVRVSLRTVVHDVPPQDVISKDNVSLKVNAVVYFRVMNPRSAIVEVENYQYATSQLAQTTLRSVLGQVELDELLSGREKINHRLQSILDQQTDPWGIKIAAVEVKHVDLPSRPRPSARSGPRSSTPMESSKLPRTSRWPPRSSARNPRPSNCATCRRSPKSPRKGTRR